MKVLCSNLQNPGQSKYIAPKYIGPFMLGRRISNYLFQVVDFETGFLIHTFDFSNCNGDVALIDAQVKAFFGE